jgi:hypothetical protein
VDSINVKTREVIRYLERQTKSRTIRTEGSAAGSLHLQAQQDMFPHWEDCEKLASLTGEETLSTATIRRHLRSMVNCVLFQRSVGNEFWILTKDEELIEFARKWEIQCIGTDAVSDIASKAIETYHRELNAYQTRQRIAGRGNKQRTLWAPPK